MTLEDKGSEKLIAENPHHVWVFDFIQVIKAAFSGAGQTGLFAVFILSLFSGCRVDKEDDPIHLSGQTMGTTYSVQYYSAAAIDFSNQIDSILVAVNQSMSTYLPGSIISKINRADTTGLFVVDQQFFEVFQMARQVYNTSQAAFDPTVMPLVNFWGFGYEPETDPDLSQLDSLVALVGFHHFSISKAISPSLRNPLQNDTSFLLSKKLAKAQLDFSAIAKGFGVDQVCRFLQSKKIDNYFVEIGGEVRAGGYYKEETPWGIGIETPATSIDAPRTLQAVVKLSEKAIATSGNYRNYREVDGKKIVHTINPKTGFTEMSNLLSVSIVADECALADAYATACMVLGLEKSLKLIESLPGLEAYFIYANEGGEITSIATEGFSKILEKNSPK